MDNADYLTGFDQHVEFSFRIFAQYFEMHEYESYGYLYDRELYTNSRYGKRSGNYLPNSRTT